jgi:hypothetical protein
MLSSFEFHVMSVSASWSPDESRGVAVSWRVSPTVNVATPGTNSSDATAGAAVWVITGDAAVAGSAAPGVSSGRRNQPAAATAPTIGTPMSHARLRRFPACPAYSPLAMGDVSGVTTLDAADTERDPPDGNGVRGV